MLQTFKGASFADTVAQIERTFIGAEKSTISPRLTQNSINWHLFSAALLLKRNASQIDEIIHSTGILLLLPSVLHQDERVNSLSLAAGNTGKGFDLETDKRIAEFTFIQWQGGSETIRQNKIFKDFYFLAEKETPKIRELYVMGTMHPLKFFNGGRGIIPILKGNAKLGNDFTERYGTKFKKVRDYYAMKKHLVQIKDIRPLLSID